MNPAPNLVLIGPMGAGKTSVGRRLAERLDLQFLDLDREIEARTGASVTMIFDCEGEAGFRARERDTLSDALAGAGVLVATGGGAVLDAGNRQLMHTRSFVVHLDVDVDGQIARLARDRSRPLLAEGDRQATLERLAQARAPLYRALADLRFDTGHCAAEAACDQLASLLLRHWQRTPAPAASPHTGLPA